MTKINETVAFKIKTLRDAGFGYKRIANQLELKAGTVKKHCQKLKSLEGLPPKIKQYKGQLVGRYSLLVKKYVIVFVSGCVVLMLMNKTIFCSFKLWNHKSLSN
jgi:hypothetical protein